MRVKNARVSARPQHRPLRRARHVFVGVLALALDCFICSCFLTNSKQPQVIRVVEDHHPFRSSLDCIAYRVKQIRSVKPLVDPKLLANRLKIDQKRRFATGVHPEDATFVVGVASSIRVV
ncbi:hypothetical protein HG530_015879 [Fusarium avenaceum]|nr:hypothetical protein HG530_015879 [Fusarium avenaceum]